MGSDPTNPSSVNYRITSVKQAVNGTTVTWESAPGRRYRVLSRDRVENGTWQVVNPSITAPGESTSWLDSRPGTIQRFYRVEDAQ